MAGHSKFKNIQHRKGKQDAQKAKIFNKIARDIVVCVRSGGEDPNANPRLRLALLAARSNNMTNDRITRAIKTGSGALAAADAEEIRYEGYGPGGVAVIVEALTDNRNRTAPEVRSAFSKYGGALGETNSVSFQFKRQGEIYYSASIGPADAVFDFAATIGADNVESDVDGHFITTSPDDYLRVSDALAEKYGTAIESSLAWEPMNRVAITGDNATSLVKLINALEDLDDVQKVFANYEEDDALLEKLSA